MGRVISHSGAEEDWRNGASESVVAIHHSGVADGGLLRVGIAANEFHPFSHILWPDCRCDSQLLCVARTTITTYLSGGGNTLVVDGMEHERLS